MDFNITEDQELLLDSLREDGKDIVLISEDQVNSFAGNMLEVRGNHDKKYLVMSEAARQ